MRSCSEQVFSKAVPIPRRGVWPRPSTAAMSNPSLSLLRWLQRLQSVGTSRYPRSVIMSPYARTHVMRIAYKHSKCQHMGSMCRLMCTPGATLSSDIA
jgi:hypothetical protein